jgi:hypothetical protein
MTTATYTCDFFGDSYTMQADFAQASSTIIFCDRPTQYQVADFRHDSDEAMRHLLGQVAEMSGDDPCDEDIADEIDDAVGSMICRDVYAEETE